MRAALGRAQTLAKAMFERCDDETLFEEAVSYAEVNRLLGRP
jgi:hypothetical protein